MHKRNFPLCVAHRKASRGHARCERREVNAAHAFLRDEGPRYDPALFLQAISWMLALFARTPSRRAALVAAAAPAAPGLS